MHYFYFYIKKVQLSLLIRIRCFSGIRKREYKTRQAEGIAIAKKQGKYKGKAPREYDKGKLL